MNNFNKALNKANSKSLHELKKEELIDIKGGDLIGDGLSYIGEKLLDWYFSEDTMRRAGELNLTYKQRWEY
ncbi:hypothetical protein [Pontibacter ruber]|uniref:Bacteriocin-type signal sequence-containing protein n=1 Tax=Pontibacter ruber TaxID=1343895 RepID=A0ABW5CRI2_9BACT|nr:hypothetical protein [Pontibacter ruber]